MGKDLIVLCQVTVLSKEFWRNKYSTLLQWKTVLLTYFLVVQQKEGL